MLLTIRRIGDTGNWAWRLPVISCAMRVRKRERLSAVIDTCLFMS